jgi:hypothetical protein
VKRMGFATHISAGILPTTASLRHASGATKTYEACNGLNISRGIGTISLISAMLPDPDVDIVKSKRRPGCVVVLRSL